MSASQTLSLFKQIGVADSVIPAPERAYFEQRLRNRMLNFLLEKFVAAQKEGLTKAELARRIGKTPDVINRWLGAPTNLTVDTICDLLLGIGGEEMIPISQSPLAQTGKNYSFYSELCEDASPSSSSHTIIESAKDVRGATNKKRIDVGMR
jgi:transcriptional regulator with XRE-family HTH domain